MKKKFIIFIAIALILLPQIVRAEWVDADRSGISSALVLADSTNSYPVEIDLDSKNRPHILFMQTSGGFPPTSYLCYLYWNGSAWVDADGVGQESVRVVNTGFGGTFSFSLNNSDQPAIAYTDSSIVLNYLYFNGSAWVDADGVGQESKQVYTNDVSGPVLRFNSNNHPTISFPYSGDVQITWDVYYLAWNGSSWVDADGTGQGEAKVYDNDSRNVDLSMSLLSNGNPAITWTNQAPGINHLDYLYWNGSAWVDADGVGQGNIAILSADHFYGSVLAISTLNRPAVAFLESQDIAYLNWNGSAWVDADGVGQGERIIYMDAGESSSPSLALKSNDYPAIAWQDYTSGDAEVYYLSWDGDEWVDGDGEGQESIMIYNDLGTQYTWSRSLVIDSTCNYPHIAFNDNVEGRFNPYYLEWWEPCAIPGPAPIILPETGKSLINYINNILTSP